MRLAVILVNYNTAADTIDCLESLKKNHLPEGLEVKTILVDNASRDDSFDLFSQKYPEVELHQSHRNLGFAGGNNLGIKAALKWNPTHVLLLNNDTLVPTNFFKQLKDSAISQKGVGIVTPLIYFAKGYEYHKHYKNNQLGRVVWSAGGVMDWNNLLGSNAHVDEVDDGQFTSVQETDFATGACLLIKREVIDQVGLINEDYFLYLEDLEFCQRAKKAGWKILFDPSIKLWHKISQSSGIGSNLNDYFITRNRLVFGMKYAGLRTKFALIREAIRFLRQGRPAQKQGVIDWFLGRLGKGSFIK